MNNLRDKTLPVTVNDITVEKSVTLQKCPDIKLGWLPSEIEFQHREWSYEIPQQFMNRYNHYLKNAFTHKHGADGTTIMLAQPPVAYPDPQKLVLSTVVNKYSYSQFYWNVVFSDANHYERAFQDLFEHGNLTFPHNLCLHLVVVTKDDQILLTYRTAGLGTFQNTWSCSIEENLVPEDLLAGQPIAELFGRAILEETGVCRDHYDAANLRVLSVFLEGTARMNIALCGIAGLKLTRDELSKVLANVPRTDYEFTRYTFLTFEEIAKELRQPSRPYHPTSRYRMLMTLLHRFGESKIVDYL